MFIKLTNASKEHKGKPLLMNTKHIVSIFPIEDDEKNTVTVIYGVLQNSWSVTETPEEIFKLIGDDDE